MEGRKPEKLKQKIDIITNKKNMHSNYEQHKQIIGEKKEKSK